MKKSELERIRSGAEGETAQNFLVNFIVCCNGDAEQVLNKCKEVLSIVFSQQAWHSDEEWKKILPKSFVENCVEQPSKEEVDKLNETLRKLPWEERRKVERKWSVEAWIYWFQPEMRQWFWWDAKIENPNLFKITVEVEGFPFPSGSLKWLAIACGAVSFDEED